MDFIEALRYYQNWAKETDFFALFERLFVYPLIHPMSHSQDFAK